MPGAERLVASLAALIAAVLFASQGVAQHGPTEPLTYPATHRGTAVEARHGQSAPDPFRWLEGDPAEDRAVADWTNLQDALARHYLASLPGRDAFASSIRALTDIERFSLPQDGALALDDWQPSYDGEFVALTLQHDGGDRREARVLRVAGAVLLDDRLADVADVPLAWTGRQGFLYSRYPRARGYGAPRGGAGVWFHRIGTPQAKDVAVYTTPNDTDLSHRAWVTSDRRWAVIATRAGLADKASLRLVDLSRVRRDGWATRVLIADRQDDWRFVEGVGRHLWFVTTQGAPNRHLVRFDVLHGGRIRPREVIGETVSTLEAARIVGNRLVLSYRMGGALRATITDLHGHPRSQIALQGIGTASGFSGRPGDPETFYSFSSFGQPPGVWRLDLATGRIAPFALPHAPFDPADILVERRRYPGKDGTMIPIYVVRSRKAAQEACALPTLLYGYGGSISH